MRVELDVDERGFGTVILDGKNISNHVRKVFVHTETGEPTEVQLTLVNVGVCGRVER